MPAKPGLLREGDHAYEIKWGYSGDRPDQRWIDSSQPDEADMTELLPERADLDLSPSRTTRSRASRFFGGACLTVTGTIGGSESESPDRNGLDMRASRTTSRATRIRPAESPNLDRRRAQRRPQKLEASCAHFVTRTSCGTTDVFPP